MLYIANASDLNVDTPERAGEVICSYFFAQNKDISTATELEKIVSKVNNPSVEIEAIITGGIIDFIKLVDRKALFIVDEHGVLFEKDPLRIHLLNPLMQLNFWGKQCKFVCVIFTRIVHAKYEKEYMINGQFQFWVIYVGPLQSNVFDILLQMHPVLRIQGIKEEAKKVNNILNIAQSYYNELLKNEKTRYYNALTSMFLSSKPVKQFAWKFLDLGLVYRYKEEATHYLPLCTPAQKALLQMYMTFELAEEIKNQLRVGSLNGDQFEDALFKRLVCQYNRTIQLNATDLNNKNKTVITLHFNDYVLIKNPQLPYIAKNKLPPKISYPQF
ncbi:hypothetical protein C2G38_2222008 [Gigaspora rosea]|uniref:Uncharacterized protein n=1 Tax=Gigaspora rosea TaxID=44941 RepID=A0A397U312_9GLOM|nr:hypothetical protein C2G38_2222008 [Gigaspora rosea]